MQLRDLFDEMPVSNGAAVPMALQKLLRENLNVAEDWQQAESLLLRAREELPQQVEILIALYKLYAYSNRFDESLAVIDEALTISAESEGFVADWRKLHQGSARWHPATGKTRYYLYSLKATGFVCLRKGEIERALEVLTKLLELDPQDQVGGSVVYEIAEGIRDAS